MRHVNPTGPRFTMPPLPAGFDRRRSVERSFAERFFANFEPGPVQRWRLSNQRRLPGSDIGALHYDCRPVSRAVDV